MAERTFDLVISGGMLVDGTGTARRRADVAVRDGVVAAIGRFDPGDARRVVDATDRVVAPGVVDAHTHYDPQVTFEPLASMSSFHGVTTVVAGNCGFSIAPCRPSDRDFVARLFAKVEQMEPSAMGAVAWDFETFGEYLAARDGRLGVNLACYVGHSNVRRWVMGADGSEREATPAEVAAMADVVAEAVAAGATGLSSSHAPTHLDGDDRPVPSRRSSREELLALAEAAARAGAGSLAYLPASAVGGLDETDEDYLIELGRATGVPVIIQGLGGRNKVDAPTATWDRAKVFLDRATALGAPVYSLLIARPPDRPLRVDQGCFHYLAVPVVAPHAPAAVRGAGRAAARRRGPGRAAHGRRALQPRPGQGHDDPAAHVAHGVRRPRRPSRARGAGGSQHRRPRRRAGCGPRRRAARPGAARRTSRPSSGGAGRTTSGARRWPRRNSTPAC